VSQEIKIPDIGDADSVAVVEVLVHPGDIVGPDDPLIVVESDKATMEIPAGCSGVIEAIRVAVGDQVAQGQVIALVAAGADQPTTAPVQGSAAVPTPTPTPTPAPASAAGAAAGGVRQVQLPDVGEAGQVVVVEIAVVVGDEVGVDDPLIVIESDKASMEIPAGVAGRIVELHVREGDEVTAGALLATLAVVGVDTRQPTATERPAPVAPPDPALTEGARGVAVAATAPEPEPAPSPEPLPGVQVYAGPAVRRLARELGVRLEAVDGSGHRGRIVKEDVKAFVKGRLTAPSAEVARGGLPPLPEVDYSRFGPVETVPLSRVRQRGADNLHRSWVNIPHVTQHDEVDVTDLEAFRKRQKVEAEAQGVKLTPLAFIVKACCHALREFPTMNASLDPPARSFILKRYYHIGIAVDTEDGLLVPVIRDADQKGILQLSREVAELSAKARNRKLAPADLQGGTFTVTSLGALGGTGFTPVINAPEIAILGVGRLAIRPHWDGAAFVPRQMLPLSLSYDHRAVNGAEAGRFVARLGALLSDIRRLTL
jgi:pyruvate dehydrogenase E2 component (dihydrolipoamide acetyltransferase)